MNEETKSYAEYTAKKKSSNEQRKRTSPFIKNRVEKKTIVGRGNYVPQPVNFFTKNNL